MSVQPLTHDEIATLESQHERIAAMLAELDADEVSAEGLLCDAIVSHSIAESDLQRAKVVLRTIKGRRMGLMSLLKRFA